MLDEVCPWKSYSLPQRAAPTGSHLRVGPSLTRKCKTWNQYRKENLWVNYSHIQARSGASLTKLFTAIIYYFSQ